MKRLTGVLVSILLLLCIHTDASAITTIPTEPFPAPSPLIISGYSVGSNVSSLEFVQIYNDSDEVLILDGWQLQYTTTLNPEKYTILTLEGNMLPEAHFVAAAETALQGDGVAHYASFMLESGNKLKSLVLLPPHSHMSSHEQPVAGSGIYKRNLTTTGYSSSTNFSKQDPVLFTQLAADPLYKIPDVPKLEIVEILPRSADCAPNDESLVCGDYVKLLNTSGQTYDASNYRLRTDSGTSELSNAFLLDWIVKPGEYVTVYLKSDGDKMSLTDSGGYVWLEDVMGLKAFHDETLVNYPSASSSTKQGWSWAFYGDKWQWTSSPQPGAENRITTPSENVQGISTAESECPAGKYRNPDTGRCRNIEDAIATLVACDEGEYRSPETNRCRKIAVAASAILTPCDPGQERNSSTNRCRTIATSSGTLAACPEGQERNPETNRCRSVVSTTAPPILTNTQPTSGAMSYWIGGAVATMALGYGVYEWRSEIGKAVRKIMPVAK